MACRFPIPRSGRYAAGPGTLLHAARRRVLAFTAADASWVIGSGILLLLAWSALPVTGRALISAVALVAEVFATLQAREIVSGA